MEHTYGKKKPGRSSRTAAIDATGNWSGLKTDLPAHRAPAGLNGITLSCAESGAENVEGVLRVEVFLHLLDLAFRGEIHQEVVVVVVQLAVGGLGRGFGFQANAIALGRQRERLDLDSGQNQTEKLAENAGEGKFSCSSSHRAGSFPVCLPSTR